MSKRQKRKKKTAFVPSIVFGTVVFGVVPACAVACGGTTFMPSGSGDAATDSPRDGLLGVADVGFDVPFSVAAVGYCGFCDGGPDGSDAADATDANDEPDTQWTVAQCGFCDGGEGG
jgi:hypothetical protein